MSYNYIYGLDLPINVCDRHVPKRKFGNRSVAELSISNYLTLLETLLSCATVLGIFQPSIFNLCETGIQVKKHEHYLL